MRAVLVAMLCLVAAGSAEAKPRLLVLLDDSNPNSRAFVAAWKQRPEFRSTLEARYELDFRRRGLCDPAPAFALAGHRPLVGFRGCDVLLWELDLQPPTAAAATPFDPSSLEARIRAVETDATDVLTSLSSRIEKTDTRVSEVFERIDSVHTETKDWRGHHDKELADVRSSLSERDRRIQAVEDRPLALPPAGNPPPRPENPLVKIFGWVLTIEQALGAVALVGTGGGAAAVLAPLAIRGLFRWFGARRERKRAAAPRQRTESPLRNPTPPSPTPAESRVVNQTQITPVYVDEFENSYAEARDKFARKYPGAVETLEAFDGMLQLLHQGKGKR